MNAVLAACGLTPDEILLSYAIVWMIGFSAGGALVAVLCDWRRERRG